MEEQALPERYWSTEEQRWIYPGDLPPMPEPAWRETRPLTVPKVAAEWFSADQMQAYARAAVLAERERLAAKWEAAHGFDKHGVAAAIRKG